MRRHAQREVFAWCPVCRVPVPVLTITVEAVGFLRRSVHVLVDGDATDYAAHMWTHEQETKVQ